MQDSPWVNHHSNNLQVTNRITIKQQVSRGLLNQVEFKDNSQLLDDKVVDPTTMQTGNHTAGLQIKVTKPLVTTVLTKITSPPVLKSSKTTMTNLKGEANTTSVLSANSIQSTSKMTNTVRMLPVPAMQP